MIYVLIAGVALAVLLAWMLYRRHPSMVRSTEDFQATLEKISPQGSHSINEGPAPRSQANDEPGDDDEQEA